MFKKCFKVILIFFCASPIDLSSSFFLFVLSLSCLLLFFSSLLFRIIPHVFLAVYCFYDIDCICVCCSSSYVCVLFLSFHLLSLLLFSRPSSLFLFAFECKQQQATSNETLTLRITKKHFLKMLTFAEIKESNPKP